MNFSISEYNKLFLTGLSHKEILQEFSLREQRAKTMREEAIRIKREARQEAMQEAEKEAEKEIVVVENKFHRYRERVWVITEKQDLKSLPLYHRRGFTDYHVDHKVSIFYGYKNGIPEEEIGHISNLRMIPWRENLKKGIKCVFE